jgi:galactokinase
LSIQAAFEATYGHPPEVTGSAPGRVNLIGEHTDYNGGAVLPAAIQRRVQVGLSRQAAPSIVVQSGRFPKQIERPLNDPKRGDWTDYAIGALWKADQLEWLTGGVKLQIESDVPDGAGVSSSAALITAILRAAAELGSVDASPVEIAKHARSVENDYIGMPCGIMDQMAVGLADQGEALALDTLDLSYEVIAIPQEWGIATIHSGIRRELADGRYKARFEECQAAAEALGTDTLCRLTQAQQNAMAKLPPSLRKRAQHVTSEHQRTRAATSAMKRGDLQTFAALMNESHTSYSQDFEASTPEIDAMIEAARTLCAKGVRLTGGGFGGCIVALMDAQALDDWIAAFLAAHPNAWRV